MNQFNRTTQLIGGLICLLGVVGVFARMSSDDGALAIAGAIVFAAGAVSQAITK